MIEALVTALLIVDFSILDRGSQQEIVAHLQSGQSCSILVDNEEFYKGITRKHYEELKEVCRKGAKKDSL